MLTKSKGDLAVAHCIWRLTRLGYEILLPIGDKQKYDLIVERSGDVRKVQVKFAGRYARGSCIAKLRYTGGNKSNYSSKRYNDGDFDYLFVFTEDEQSFFIPWQVVRGKAGIALGSPRYASYKI